MSRLLARTGRLALPCKGLPVPGAVLPPCQAGVDWLVWTGEIMRQGRDLVNNRRPREKKKSNYVRGED